MKLPSVEQTALDLVRSSTDAGGWDNLAAVLVELAPQLDSKDLLQIAKKQRQVGPLQRLGYLLQFVGAQEPARALAPEIEKRAIHYRALDPKMPTTNAERNERWHVLVNRPIEPD